MEERDVQIRGYKVRLPLDLFVVASRQPRGLHQPRAHHHAAEGPLRLADPHPLPAHASSTRSTSWSRSAPRSPPTSYEVERARVHEGDRRRDHPPGPPQRPTSPSARASACACRSPTTRTCCRTRCERAIRLAREAGGAARLRPRRHRRLDRPARSSWRPWATADEEKVDRAARPEGGPQRLQPALPGRPVRRSCWRPSAAG